MAIDFFDSQEQARRNTGQLVLLFIVAVAGIIALVYLAFSAVMMSSLTSASATTSSSEPAAWSWWDSQRFAIVCGSTLAVVLTASFYKLIALSSGGAAVAESLGGRLLSSNSPDPVERKILNVVEEMAIASGTPVPPVYLIEEQAINAFAAGYRPDDAVIGITRGCVQQLSRDQLQGVVAHEFSHILSGDMRLNIRLIGILHGILVIGIVGYFVFRSAMCSGAYGHRRSRDKSNPLPLILLGLALMVIGYLGTFFGELIKAAVSRQREFLADASAVQFTRNPGGIAGALKVIGGLSHGSLIGSPKAKEVSHMFFGQGVTSALGSMLATHPPLAERIHRIDASFDGKFTQIEPAMQPDEADRPTTDRQRTTAALASAFHVGEPSDKSVSADQLFRHVGQPSIEHLTYASELIASLPNALREAAYEPFGARALIYALVIARASQPRQRQLQHLSQQADVQVFQETRKLLPLAELIDIKARLPLVDMAIGTLRSLSSKQYELFRSNLEALMQSDDRIDLFKFTLGHILETHLDGQFRPVQRSPIRYESMRRCVRACSLLISTLANVGHSDPVEACKTFRQAGDQLHLAGMVFKPRDDCSLDGVAKALEVLTKIRPRHKRDLLASCAICVSADGRVTVDEAELLRAIADMLGCPVPPYLP